MTGSSRYGATGSTFPADLKVRLEPGAEFDLLTQAELHATLEAIRSGWARGPLTVVPTPDVGLDANGNTAAAPGGPLAATRIFDVKQGQKFTLHRLSLSLDGHTAADPFQDAAAYLELRRSGRMVDTFPLSGAYGLPIVVTYGSADGPVYQNGQPVELLIAGGPASTALQVAMQGTLEPLTVT